MYRAISFDFWKTLGDPSPVFMEERDRILVKHLRCSLDDARAAYRKVKDSLDADAETWGSATTPLKAFMRLSMPFAVQDIYAFYRDFQKAALANPPAIIGVDVLDALANDHMLFLISNTNFIGGEVIAQWLARYPFTKMFFSDQLGVSKPDRRAFEAVLYHAREHDASIRPAEILHVGDNEVCDVKGARNMGFAQCLVTGPDDTERAMNKLARIAA